MTSRRKMLFGGLFGGSAALIGGPSALARSAVAQPPADTGALSGEIAMLERLMTRTLEGELGDEATARQLASVMAEAGFRWHYPTFSAREADSIVAYSFGYRSATGKVDPDTGLSDGEETPVPGPVNEMLAEAVHAIARIRPVRVYAQWEIAEALVSRYQMKDVAAIYPVKAADGRKTYLSTDGVAKAAVQLAGSAAALGNVAVVGHRDHAKRCILVSRENGMRAAAVREVPLPVEYDPESAQPWTRRRDAYLLNDIIAQLMMARTRMRETLPKS